MMSNKYGKWYACWKKNGVVDCSVSCMEFMEAERFLREKRKEGAVTTLETCEIKPQIIYGHIAAALRASERLVQ